MSTAADANDFVGMSFSKSKVTRTTVSLAGDHFNVVRVDIGPVLILLQEVCDNAGFGFSLNLKQGVISHTSNNNMRQRRTIASRTASNYEGG